MSRFITETYGGYIKLTYPDKPGYIVIKAEEEGFVVDIMPDKGNDPDSSCYSFYNELET